MILLHKKCKGRVTLDLTKAVKLLTPSFSVSFNGVTAGIVDFHPTSTPVASFYCIDCDKEILSVEDELVVQCSVCREYVDVSSAQTTEYTPCLCPKCDEGLTSGKSTNSRVLEFKKYLSVSSYQKKSLAALLKQKINMQ